MYDLYKKDPFEERVVVKRERRKQEDVLQRGSRGDLCRGKVGGGGIYLEIDGYKNREENRKSQQRLI